MRKFYLSNTVVFVLNEHGEICGKTNAERGSSGELLPECLLSGRSRLLVCNSIAVYSHASNLRNENAKLQVLNKKLFCRTADNCRQCSYARYRVQ